MKKLRRSRNKVIAGVCGGVAEYINPEIDPVAVRVATIILSFFIPIIPVLYIVMAIIIPSENDF
ncbi:PspC domain-containing protein [Halosquirtibacter xylanolyticus]|uniref:PspC domain-containing protein n=1 Tax=Halosquirtibacter xylanolyticus TaxID=3374599 RepID=UPI00374975A8|nr:PspC domain-containing protein [Prolixibacteraceae bacterium]